MIKKWIKGFGRKNKQSADAITKTTHQSSTAKNTDKPAPAARNRSHSKSTQSNKPAWDISQYKVPEIEGKTRFHDFQLHDNLMQAIQKVGFDYCTPIQAQTLPHTLKGLDMVGKAQTGTGKTAAFLITIIDQLLCNPREEEYFYEPRALVIAPTRELVQQIAEDAVNLCQFSPLSVVAVVGGEPYEKQMKQLQQSPVDILIATPGRLIDFVERQNVYLDQVETLVLDEADRMLDMGFIPQVKRIVRNTPHKDHRQTLLFSATFTQDIINLSQQWTIDAASVEIEPEHVATDTVKQIAYMVSDREKIKVLGNLLREKEIERAIVFANRRDQTHFIHQRLQKSGLKVGILSGEVPQAKRTRTLELFKDGKIQVLIATDVVGRGIHIDGVSHVINYNLPQEPENYVHRIGRTGRAGASGIAISLIGEEDAYEVSTLEELLGSKMDMQLPPEHLV